ncbi:MAG: SIMPL domain-containing protein [Sphingomonas sp.]|nr:SIMPL domain-containing protein [Sphingomonas sp.]
MRWIALAATAATLAACQRAAPDPRGVAHDETLLTVSAMGRTDTRPDEARLQLGVQSMAASSGEASRLNREKMDRVAAALAKLGVRPDDLQTRNLSLQRIDYGPERGRFRADNLVEVKMRAMDRVGDAVTAVTEAGANVLSGPELRVSDREAASRSAYAAAYRAARARAEAYSQAAGLKIDRVLGIYDGGESNVPPPYTRSSAVDMVSTQSMAPPPPPAVAPAPFNPGINTTEVRVRVDFALSEK